MGLFTSVPDYPQSVDRRSGNAIHEASHARAFQAAGVPVQFISFVDEWTARTHVERGFPASPDDVTVGFLVGIVAGHVGEARYLKRESGLGWGAALRLAASKSEHDLHAFKQYSKQIGLSKEKAVLLARELVGREWRQIETLADRMLRKGIVRF